MANPRHVKAVKQLYRAFQKGDVPALLACMTDDVVFTMPAMPGVRLRTVYRGKKGVEKFLRDRARLLRYRTFDPQRYFSDQDCVLVRGQTAGTVISTGRRFRYDWVQVFDFGRANLIRSLHELPDTHVLVRAFAKRAR